MAISPADQANLAKLVAQAAPSTLDASKTGTNQFNIEAYAAQQQRIIATQPGTPNATNAQAALDAIAAQRDQNQRDFAMVSGLGPATKGELQAAVAAWDALAPADKQDVQQAGLVEQARGVLTAENKLGDDAAAYAKQATEVNQTLVSPTGASDQVDGAPVTPSPQASAGGATSNESTPATDTPSASATDTTNKTDPQASPAPAPAPAPAQTPSSTSGLTDEQKLAFLAKLSPALTQMLALGAKPDARLTAIIQTQGDLINKASAGDLAAVLDLSKQLNLALSQSAALQVTFK